MVLVGITDAFFFFLFLSDAELSGHAPPEPDIVSRTSLLGDVSFGNRLDTLLEPTEYGLMPPILLSLCGGLGDGGELSHGKFLMWREKSLLWDFVHSSKNAFWGLAFTTVPESSDAGSKNIGLCCNDELKK